MRLLLVLLLVASLGCIQAEQKQTCQVAYNPAGVAVTNMQLDYPKIYAGNKVRLSLEVANLGEETGKDIDLKVTGPEHYFTIPAESVIAKASMEPPDPNKCIEGGIKSATVQLESKPGVQALDGVPIKLKLAYGYKTRAWADVVVLSEQQWAVRMQEGFVPKLYQGQTVSPIKIKLGVPAVPVVGNSVFQVQLSLENPAASSSGPTSTTDSVTAYIGDLVDPDMVKNVTITIPDGFEFSESSACTEVSADACRIENFKVTKDPDNVREKRVSVKLKDSKLSSLVEESFKIDVEADYGYTVFYNTNPVIIVSGD